MYNQSWLQDGFTTLCASVHAGSWPVWHTVRGWHILLQTAVRSPPLHRGPTHAEAVLWDVPKLFTVCVFMLMCMHLVERREDAKREQNCTVAWAHDVNGKCVFCNALKRRWVVVPLNTEQFYQYSVNSLVSFTVEKTKLMLMSSLQHDSNLLRRIVLSSKNIDWPTVLWCHH